MQITHKTVDEKRGIVQITTTDERWYKVGDNFYPSVTWVLDSYPKGVGFMNYLKTQGDNSEAIGKEARDRGSIVHNAIEDLINGKEVFHNSIYGDSSGSEREMTPYEYSAVRSFKLWWDSVKAVPLKCEFMVIGDDYAGTVDLLCKINDEVWLIDVKTSKDVYPQYALQVSAYARAKTIDGKELNVDRMGILQVGYARNKNGFKLTEVEDKYTLFRATYALWKNEHGGEHPKQINLPLSVKL